MWKFPTVILGLVSIHEAVVRVEGVWTKGGAPVAITRPCISGLQSNHLGRVLTTRECPAWLALPRIRGRMLHVGSNWGGGGRWWDREADRMVDLADEKLKILLL
jgi:hypothetical protein